MLGRPHVTAACESSEPLRLHVCCSKSSYLSDMATLQETASDCNTSLNVHLTGKQSLWSGVLSSSQHNDS